MTLGYIVQGIMVGGILEFIPYIVDFTLITVIAITALILSIKSYRNSKKILKEIQALEKKGEIDK